MAKVVQAQKATETAGLIAPRDGADKEDGSGDT
jgi:hypothetical protein